jgi:hypothetical protein
MTIGTPVKFFPNGFGKKFSKALLKAAADHLAGTIVKVNDNDTVDIRLSSGEVIKGVTPAPNSIDYYPYFEDATEVTNSVIAVIEKQPIASTIGTSCILDYGINIILDVTPENYAVRLPIPSVGKTVKVTNKSNMMIALFPYNSTGQINALALGVAACIPNDGRLYTITCTSTSNGTWAWTAAATATYDSGEITVNTTLNQITLAVNALNTCERPGFVSTTAWGYDGKNKPLILTGTESGSPYVAFKEATPWMGITKVKVYTNLSATGDSVMFGLTGGSQRTAYDNTGAIVTNGSGSAGNYGSVSSGFYGYCSNAVTGATLAANALTANAGDPGTAWGELNIVGGNNGLDSRIGDVNFGTNGQGLIEWLSSYLTFGIKPTVALTGFKFRFFIEHY